MKKTESELENKCCTYARSKGIASVKIEKCGHVGIPDRLFIKEGGECLFVEFKKTNGRGVISDAQNLWAKFLDNKHAFIDDYNDFTSLNFFCNG